MLRRLRGDPRPFIVLVVAVAIIGAFFIVVAPLFATSGNATAELGGTIPTAATVGRTLEIDVGYDNTGNSVIDPVCVLIGVQGPMRASSVTFQGLDVVTVSDGRACGGSLNGQETINVRVVMTPLARGDVTLTLAPAQGTTALGAGIAGTIVVAAG